MRKCGNRIISTRNWRFVKIANPYKRGLEPAAALKLLLISSLLAFVPLLRSAHALPMITSNLTVTSQDTDGGTITGYYTVLLDSSGNTLATGFTPVTFRLDITIPTTSYAVLVENFQGIEFNHWVDTGTSDNPRDVSVALDPALATGSLTITAVYTDTNVIPAGDSRISVATINSQGQEIDGYYTTLWQNCQDQLQFGNCVLLDECFSPCSFLVVNGGEYQVAVADFGPEFFTHWSDNTLNRFHDLTVPGTTTTISLTAVYTP